MNAEIEAQAPKRPPADRQPVEAALVPDALLTADTVCQLIGIKRRTLREWVQQGRFPPPKSFSNGKVKRWRAQVVTDFLALAERSAEP